MTPNWLGRPLSIASAVGALVGALLVLTATVYGSWTTLIPAAAAFALGGLSWQIADRMASARH